MDKNKPQNCDGRKNTLISTREWRGGLFGNSTVFTHEDVRYVLFLRYLPFNT